MTPTFNNTDEIIKQGVMYQVFIDESFFRMIQGEENVYEYISSSPIKDIAEKTKGIDKRMLIDRLKRLRGFESIVLFEGLRIKRITKNEGVNSK